ncbi:MAG: ABC transporter ATP-binding protein [Pirellulaceae bacterium]
MGVELRGVFRVFPGGGKGVDGLDLVVRQGELMVLVGPSGSGKTTTLRVIAGLEEATSGTVWIDGREVTELPPRDRNVAMVFQGLGLYEHLSTFENLAFGLKARGQGSGVRNQVEEIASQLGIQHLLQRRPGELSGGEQQRVALGRALVRQPAAMLLDEPLSSLDPPLRSELRRILKDIQQRLKVTTVYVTHDQGEAMSLGERIAVIKDGKIEQVGTPAEIYDQPRNRFVAGFFGEGMNWGRQKAVGSKQETGDRGHETVLGVRPEDVLLRKGTERTESLSGIVKEVQWLGPHAMVEVELEESGEGTESTEKSKWLSRVSGRADYRVGELVSIEVSQGKEHWFDRESGERISVGKT